jgi:hypothetical protein
MIEIQDSTGNFEWFPETLPSGKLLNKGMTI